MVLMTMPADLACSVHTRQYSQRPRLASRLRLCDKETIPAATDGKHEDACYRRRLTSRLAAACSSSNAASRSTYERYSSGLSAGDAAP